MYRSQLITLLLAGWAGAADLPLAEAPTVGLKTTTTGPMTLSFKPDGGEVVAVLPRGAKTEVLLSDDAGHYLLRSDFGLVGWARAGGAGKDDFSPEQLEQLEQRGLDPATDVSRRVGLAYLGPLGQPSPRRFYLNRQEQLQTDAKDGNIELMPQEELLQTALAPGGPRFFVLCSGTRPIHFSCRWLDSEPITGRALGQPPALGGSRFYRPGNGFVYSLSSDTGSSHSTGHRQKWALLNGQFEEVKQPYYYLGRENSVYRGLAGPLGGYDDEIQQKPVALTDASGTQTVATLQPGDRVTLLLLDNQYECPAEDSVHGSSLCLAERYLLRTRDGRQGWLKVRDGEPDTTSIDGLNPLAG